jgi:hypothetical protein
MSWDFLGTDWRLFGILASIAFVSLLTFATCVFFYVRRLRRRPSLPISEGIGAKRAVLAKVRKREPMSADEFEFARQTITDQRSLSAFSIPAAIFSLGCFYVLGSLEQLHGATPSERTFLGVIPMLGSINVTVQLLRVGKLKRRLPKSV